MTTLQATIKNKKPIKVYFINDKTSKPEYFDTMNYSEKEKRYECDFGNIPMEKIPQILSGKIDHIKIEGVENE